MGNFIKVAKTKDIPLGEGRSYALEDTTIGVYHLQDGFFAMNNVCPHAGGPIAEGTVNTEGIVLCPYHGWAFDIRTGSCKVNSSYTQRRYPLKIEDGAIFVEI